MQESIWSDTVVSFLEGFLRIVVASGAGLAALKAYELLSRHMVAYSEAMAVDYF